MKDRTGGIETRNNKLKPKETMKEIRVIISLIAASRCVKYRLRGTVAVVHGQRHHGPDTSEQHDFPLVSIGVPEPSVIALLSIAAICLLLFRRPM
jgi:hypothetical protein